MHPFEGDELHLGHSTLIEELLRDLPEQGSNLLAVVAACGGGGLSMGILKGLERCFATSTSSKGKNCPILFVAETHGADCFHQSCAAERPVHLEAITSIAKSLGSLSCETLFKRCAGGVKNGDGGVVHDDRVVVSYRVTDKQAVQACIEYEKNHGVLVEPACGAGLAFAYHFLQAGAQGPAPEAVMVTGTGANAAVFSTTTLADALAQAIRTRVDAEGGRGEQKDGRSWDIVVEVCGGSMCDQAMLSKWAAELGAVV